MFDLGYFHHSSFSFHHSLLMWGPVASRVLFKLNRLDLWPNDPVRGRRHIRGQSAKVEVEIVLQEELKDIYKKPKPIRDEKSSRNICPRWLETSLPPWILF